MVVANKEKAVCKRECEDHYMLSSIKHDLKPLWQCSSVSYLYNSTTCNSYKNEYDEVERKSSDGTNKK